MELVGRLRMFLLEQLFFERREVEEPDTPSEAQDGGAQVSNRHPGTDQLGNPTNSEVPEGDSLVVVKVTAEHPDLGHNLPQQARHLTLQSKLKLLAPGSDRVHITESPDWVRSKRFGELGEHGLGLRAERAEGGEHETLEVSEMSVFET